MSDPKPLDERIIRTRIESQPSLASLRSINTALGELVHAEFSFTSQIAEIIRRDPSLTARLLKLVNSVFFGLSHRVSNIEDAVFYLGLRQIRELALATPVIEELENLNTGTHIVDWKELWQHSIGTAILTRETLSMGNVMYEDDTDYIVGLVHDIGKIVMAFGFPDHFTVIHEKSYESVNNVCQAEKEVIGADWDHAQIGAHYLKRHQLAPEIVEAVKFHNDPENAPEFQKTAAAVQIADHLVRSAEIPGIEQVAPITDETITTLPGWSIIFGDDPDESKITLASLKHTLARLPQILKGLI